MYMRNEMKNICIITARGGSKRIPKKNIKDFCGKPILAYSIEAALKSNIFDEIMVSTDSEEIKNIAIKYGASVPFMRSEKTSNDFAGTYDVLMEVIQEYKKNGKIFDNMCCMYPTAPFVTAKKLQNAYKLLIDNNADGVSPYVSFSFPPQRAFYIRDGRLVAVDADSLPKRSQDLEKMYHDCGQFYFYNLQTFTGKRKPNNIYIPIEYPESEVQDIDNLEDWKIAEIKYKLMSDNEE